MPSNPHSLSASDLFKCTQCGDCCRGYGGTYVSSADIEAIAHYLNISFDSLRRRFCTPSGQRLVLAQQENGYCAFWDRNCTIHPVKPRMCRMWPFIPSLLVDLSNWQTMADSCPGMRRDIDSDVLRVSLQQIIQGPGR